MEYNNKKKYTQITQLRFKEQLKSNDTHYINQRRA